MSIENIDFSLCFQNAKCISFNKYENDFAFIVNGKRYDTPRIVADILSPKVRQLHFIDSTINEMIINTKSNIKSPNSDIDDFEDFLKLATFQKVTINSEKLKLYSEYFAELGNIDEYICLYSQYRETLNVSNVIDRLFEMNDFLSNSNEIDIKTVFFLEMIEFCSIHFEELDKEKLKQLDSSIIEEIIKNDHLLIDDEDSLLTFILMNKKNNEFDSNLFEYVIINNLSYKGLKKFIQEFDIEFINNKIWGQICDRLLNHNSNDTSKNKRYIKNNHKENGNIKDFEYKTGNEFHGILRYLTNETNGNIHDNGTIEITSNSINDRSQNPKNVVDFENDKSYCSNSGNNSFICFDFRDKSILLTNYSIQSRSDQSKAYERYFTNLKNWVIEVSNDNKNWIEIDRHENDSSLNGRGNISTFKINNLQPNFYHFVRLRQIGDSWFGSSNKFGFKLIEFYGKLKLP